MRKRKNFGEAGAAMTAAAVIPLRAALWLGYLSNAELISRFCAAVDAHYKTGSLAVDAFHHEIVRRQEAGTLSDEDW